MEYNMMPLPQQMGELTLRRGMTDDQLEVLRKQIVVYTIISQQLLQLHNSLTSHEDLAGAEMGEVTKHGQRRKRWHPNDKQLEILCGLYNQDTRTPNKIKLQEIASGLSKYGVITTSINVHNWFQNKRGRSKQKAVVEPLSNEPAVSVEASSGVCSPFLQMPSWMEVPCDYNPCLLDMDETIYI